mgnify:CR=1 FL=1
MALIDEFLPALAFAAMLASEENLADTPYATGRADMDRLLDHAAEKSRRNNPYHAESALFAACAFADEAVLGSSWQGREEWLRDKLQQKRFNTANAGQEFYERMAGLSEAAHGFPSEEGGAGFQDDITDRHRREALEVYMACLSLGFRGKFYDEQGKNQIDRLTEANLERLHLERFLPEGRVFPETYTVPLAAPEASRFRPMLKALVLFGLPALLGAGIFATYSSLLSTFVSNWLRAL